MLGTTQVPHDQRLSRLCFPSFGDANPNQQFGRLGLFEHVQ